MTGEWKTVKLGELGTIVGGATPSTRKHENYDNGTIAWITPKDLSNHNERFISRGERNITETGLKSCSAQLMPKHSVLFSSRAPIGYVAIAANELCTNQGFKSIVPNGETDYLFLYYLLTYNKNKIEHLGSGTTFKEVSGSVMRNIEVRVPPLDVQRRIAAVLKPLDDKIELNGRINAALERVAQALFKRQFVRFEPYGGTMPPSWRVGTLSEIAEFVGGYSYKSSELKESNTAMATIKNFDRKGGFKLDGFKELVPSAKIKQSQYAELFDTFVAHTDLTQNAEVVGNAEMLMSKAGYERIAFSMDLVKVVPKTPDISKFTIAALLRNSRFKAHCLHYVNGTTVLHLNKKALPEYKIALPDDLSELKQFDELITPIYKMIAHNTDESRTLARLRDVLLPRLMSGEVDVRRVSVA